MTNRLTFDPAGATLDAHGYLHAPNGAYVASFAVPPPQPVAAYAADKLVDTIGVNTHVNYGGDNRYQNYAPGIGAPPDAALSDCWGPPLWASGIRFVRDGIFLDPYQFGIAQHRHMYDAHGIRLLGGAADGVGTNTHDVLQRLTDGSYGPNAHAMMAGLQGPNERDNPFLPNVGGDAANWHQRIVDGLTQIAAFKTANPAWADVPTIGAPLVNFGNVQALGAEVAGLVDHWSTHPYNYSPEAMAPFSQAIAAITSPGKIPWQTEWGRPTSTTLQDPLNRQNSCDEANQAILVLRGYLDAFRVLGPGTKTFIYELLDEWIDPAGPSESNFGLLRWDYTYKPSMTALRRTIDQFDDPAGAASVAPVRIAHNALQAGALVAGPFRRSDGKALLALWNPDPVWDFDPAGGMGALPVIDRTVLIRIRAQAPMSVYRPTLSATPATSPASAVHSLAVGRDPLVVVWQP